MKTKHADKQTPDAFNPSHFNSHTVPVLIVAELTRTQYNTLLKALNLSNSTDIKQ